MKKIFVFPFSILLSFCNTTKVAIEKDEIINDESIVLLSNCPEEGKCSIALQKNKSILMRTDEIGNPYYNLIDNEAKSVIVFQYNKNVEENLQDANYQEEILFEIDNSKENNFKLVDAALEKSKILYGRYCYCRDKTGIFKINQGSLEVIQNKNFSTFKLEFETNSIPHIINTIEGRFK